MQFYFNDRTEPISYGKKGVAYHRAAFNTSQTIRRIEVTETQKVFESEQRTIKFYDAAGKELAGYKNHQGEDRHSVIGIDNPLMPSFWPSGTV